MTSVVPTGSHFEAADPGEIPEGTFLSTKPISVQLVISATQLWILDSTEVKESIERADGRVEITADVWGLPDLKTILLRLGPTCEVIAPPSLRNLQSETAEALLALYH